MSDESKMEDIKCEISSLLSEPGTSSSFPQQIFETPNSPSEDIDVGSPETVPAQNDEASIPLSDAVSELDEASVPCGPDEFFFDSDHPALKKSQDYRKLLHTVMTLIEARAQAIRDLDKLYDARDKALADPIAFVEKLQRREDVGIPKPIKIPTIPVIDWNKYSLMKQDSAFLKQPYTRQATKSVGHVLGLWTKSEQGKGSRGRPPSDPSKPPKCQPWTAEEQKRLESLLLEYPTEEIETRRWKKIAKALGNRTPTQVASRVQKYFIKLMKAGLPVPGRQPNSCYMRKPKRHVIRHQPSTFLVSHTLPVFINEDDENSSSMHGFSGLTGHSDISSDSNCSDEDDVEASLKDTAEYRELIAVKKALKKKQKSLGLVQHIGFKCAHCEFEPIIGVRYHCTECPQAVSVDFCEDCVNSNREIGSHTSSHRLEAILQASSAALDMDYMNFAGNYLDTNYMPAT